MRKLNARELRTTPVDLDEAKKIRKNPITIICDNVLDTYNVGAIFRLADAVAAEKVYLCGATETPPNSKIKKASINTWQWVCWQYAETATAAISRLRQDYDGQAKIKNPAYAKASAGRQKSNIRIIAVEQDERSVPFYKIEYQFPLAIVVGNETYGVSKEVLDMADEIVELPMWGVNRSLNVMVSCGIVLYKIMEIACPERTK
ncbi:MAG: tRNA/rRNA methyltransferase [Candidatus Gottesmanbacteria bacterium GW2011_GWA2_44_17]|uniref:tRNA/rRNA methyltransferase n=1 Tax=Candidatus Gottesmanbacteria bacterium GW2011_GWA2_44_17 TaxID=1618444 RepID=A0A0G1HFF1_9BACT|nr:MAG: TRNA/rRNA methyltransferase [Microgenomates group bacterium GW2011_GWC1_43_11]KKT46066.1 MAG: tRNA/rRNA methyltransferase [Candidatus Gottesmanbacteria bacterium GW2011_GWA2_44_17]